MIVKLLTEHHLECLSLKGGGRGSSESTLVKMPHFLKSYALAHFIFKLLPSFYWICLLSLHEAFGSGEINKQTSLWNS